MPRTLAAISFWLPKSPVRGPTGRLGLECDWEECEVSYVINAERYYGADSADARAAVSMALGRFNLLERLLQLRRAALGGQGQRPATQPS